MKTSVFCKLLFTWLVASFSVSSGAAVLHGTMSGTVTGYESIPGADDFNQWYFGDNRSPIGLKVVYHFSIFNLDLESGEPVVNRSTDPLHYGTYGGHRLTMIESGNVFGVDVRLMGNGASNPPGIGMAYTNTTQSLINDVAPGDQFAWSSAANGAPIWSGPGPIGSIAFSLTTDQQILTSGDSFQKFIWTSAADPNAKATGTIRSGSDGPIGSYTFAIDTLSVIPLPAPIWLLASALLTLVGFGRRARLR